MKTSHGATAVEYSRSIDVEVWVILRSRVIEHATNREKKSQAKSQTKPHQEKAESKQFFLL